jgi:hypothetical protein
MNVAVIRSHASGTSSHIQGRFTSIPTGKLVAPFLAYCTAFALLSLRGLSGLARKPVSWPSALELHSLSGAS